MHTVTSVDYVIIDSMNRIRQRHNLGVYVDEVKMVCDKCNIIAAWPKHRVEFNEYQINHLFEVATNVSKH